MKKLLALFLALGVCFVCFGCSKEKDDKQTDDGKISAVAENADGNADGDEPADETKEGESEPEFDTLDELINSDEMQAAFASGVGRADEYDVTMTSELDIVIFTMKLKANITEDQKEQLVKRIAGEDLWTAFSLESFSKSIEDAGFIGVRYQVVIEDQDGSALYDAYIEH